MQALYTAISPRGAFIFQCCGVLRGALVFCVNIFAVSHCRRAPRGNFLYEQKVTKESFRRRGLRFPRLLKTSTLEPPKRNRARFPFDSLHGMAKLQQTSVVFCTKFIFAKKSIGNVKHCTNLRGFQKGDRDPTSVVAGEGSHSNKKSRQPRSGLVPLGETPSPCARLW